MRDECSDPSAPAECWRPVPGWEGVYDVSDLGNLRRVPQLMRPTRGPDGYQRVSLWRRNRGHSYLVHRLVLEAFMGPPPDGYEVDHLNATRHDNRLANLEYVSRSENILRSGPRRIATQARGEHAGRAKRTAEQVREMRRLAAAGLGYRELARRFGVAYPTARNVVLRERWAHIE